ncbi:fluconazole resistance (FLU1) [Fusarium agapanthi]|uniref:Fluconazole resistance (FLU1) n=1 Tax=Fusarium agapanthi TaxID=1803897 RepID=A0A9P5BCJ0_9HYPO|nr:fluconazole resistance (FLU1) [Fusarium agapanthi]
MIQEHLQIQERLQVDKKILGLSPETLSQNSSSTETLSEIQVLLGLEALEPSFSLSEYLRSVGVELFTSQDELDIFLSPFGRSGRKKIITLLGPFMASTLAAYAAGAYALASEPLHAKWDISDTLFNVGISLFVVGFGFTPMICPHQRNARPILDPCWLWHCMMVSRLNTGNGAAVFATLTGGVVSDLYRKEDRNTPMALYSMKIMLCACDGGTSQHRGQHDLAKLCFPTATSFEGTYRVLVYGFDNAEVGAVYTAPIVGSIIGIGISLLQEPIIKRVLPHKKPMSTPEQRLLAPCIQSILLPIGLFWFFMTARPGIPWISPCIALASCSMGIFSFYLAVFNYLADTYHGLTLQGTGGLLGGLGLLLTGIPWLLYFYGQKVRARSPFAKGME